MACNFHFSFWPDGSAARRFGEPTFRPSGATNHWNNFLYLFAHLYLLLFSSLLFSSLTLPTSAFPSVNMVRNLTSKLPSNTIMHITKYYIHSAVFRRSSAGTAPCPPASARSSGRCAWSCCERCGRMLLVFGDEPGPGLATDCVVFIVKNRQRMVVSGFTRKNGGFTSKNHG